MLVKEMYLYLQWTSSLTALVTGCGPNPLSARHVYTPPWRFFLYLTEFTRFWIGLGKYSSFFLWKCEPLPYVLWLCWWWGRLHRSPEPCRRPLSSTRLLAGGFRSPPCNWSWWGGQWSWRLMRRQWIVIRSYLLTSSSLDSCSGKPILDFRRAAN